MKISAKWQDDCQGKKDYDGKILSVSTRYWPRGGGFFVGAPGRGIEGNEARPDIKPSATSEILLHYDGGEHLVLAKENFKGETQKEVQQKVEAWAQSRFDEVVGLLLGYFKVKIDR